MNPSQILVDIVAGSPRRDEAARALMALLEKLARTELREPSSGEQFQIPRADQQEVVAAVLAKVVQKSPLPVAGKSDGEALRYLQTMLVRGWLTMRKRAARLVATTDEAMDQHATRAEPEATLEGGSQAEIERARVALERVLDHALGGIEARYRENYQRSWRQLAELVFDGGNLRAMIERDEGVNGASDPAAFEQARNRVFKYHERLRKRLKAAVEELADSGGLPGEDADTARRVVDRVLVRCQRSPARGSSGRGAASTERRPGAAKRES